MRKRKSAKNKFFDFLMRNKENIVNIIVILIIWGFLLSYFKPSLILSGTTTSGGDTGSHYYPAWYMKNYLLPHGKIIGWCPGWYAGFPIFQFYFPLPYVLMSILGYLIGLQVSFKLVTILGTFLLPLCAFFSMKFMKFKFPVPIIAAIFTLPFLFMEANSMWGGNIPSTLAGEFSYSLSLSLLVLFVGSLYKGIKENRYWIWNGILFALIFSTHVFTAIAGVLFSTFFLLINFKNLKALKKNFIYLFKMYSISFLLVAYWAVPLITKIGLHTKVQFIWNIESISKIIPEILVPFAALAAIGFLISLKEKNPKAIYLFYTIGLSGFLYFLAKYIGMSDIRFVPILQIILMITGSYGIYVLSKRLKAKWVLTFIILFLTIFWVNNHVSYIDNWIKWNYEGFESKAAYGQLHSLTEYLKELPPGRIDHEYSGTHNKFGTPRTFEDFPYFTGKPTLEGLYMESSLSSPFVFYLQSEISKTPTCPIPGETCMYFNPDKALQHMELFNIKYVVATSEKLKNAIENNSEYKFLKSFNEINVYEINNSGYVTIPKYKPVFMPKKNWKKESEEWYKDYMEVPIIFTDNLPKGEKYYTGEIKSIPKIPLKNKCNIEEEVKNEEVMIKTNCLNQPHWVKISYFPNWKAEGADIYLATPSFMMIYPHQEKVRLYYGKTYMDIIGEALTYIGIIIVVILLFSKKLNIKPKLEKTIKHIRNVK